MTERMKIGTIVGIIALVFSTLGTVIGNVYVVGKYAQKIESTETMAANTLNKLDKYIDEQKNTYLSKEAFSTFLKERDNSLAQIQNDIREIRNYILNSNK